ncbi:16S rRNA methyltransferase [Thermogladius sp. 4427co]|uniref:16S rRNA methyltransferase n=1 Tax=Thermogladius sp. 4427co TaxID=3450718 RepID=UPI003F7A9586
MKLSVLLLEAGLELVPEEIWEEPSVIKNARRRGKKPSEILLDISVHYQAAKKLKDWFKRGRPDIVHSSLLQILDSPASRRGLVNTYIHTYQGLIIWLDHSVRIPRNYNRFVGLIEQLLVKKEVPPGSRKPLLKVLDYKLEDFLKESGLNGLILLWEKGERKGLRSIISEAVENNYAIGIGAFQHGDFGEYVLEIATKKYSIFSESLPAWIVASRLITAYEAYLNLLTL